MSLVVSNSGELRLLEWALRSTSTPENLLLKLFSNNYTPNALTSAAANLTQATFAGYEPKTLARASWSVPVTNSEGKAEINYTVQAWNVGDDQVIYGYWIEGETSGTLIWAERFGTSRAAQSGDVFRVTPKMTLGSQS